MLILVEVSIIVPVYNVAEYLSECLDSLINQTFEDIEIICINDGSTDNSLEILEKYANDDSRISITSQENGGLSAARNTGIKKASGKYIYYMDSDDILELDAIEKLYSLAEEKSLDFIIFKLINFYHETGEKFESQYYNMEFLKDIVGDRVFSYDDIKDVMTKIAVNVQSKFYRHDLIRDMKFHEGLIFEDNPYFFEAMFKAKRAYFLDDFIYLKRERKHSITASPDKSFADVIPISNDIIELTRKYGHYDELKESVIKKKLRRIFVRFDEIDDKYKQYFYDLMKDDFTQRKDECLSVIVEGSDTYYAFLTILECDTVKEFELSKKIYSLEHEHGKLTNRYRHVKMYNTSRIQFKNHGGADNNIEIIESSDDEARINIPEWLCDDEGHAVIVQSDINELDLKLKVIGDGLLRINFESYNLTLDNGERYWIYIDYTELYINSKQYLFEDTLTSFNEPLLIEKRVSDGEEIDIHVKWTTITQTSGYVNKYKRDLIQSRRDYGSLRKDYNDLKKDLKKEKDKNKKLNTEINTLKSTKSWKVTKPLRSVGNTVRRK